MTTEKENFVSYYVLEDESSGIVGGVHEDKPILANKYARGTFLSENDKPKNGKIYVEMGPEQYPDYFELQATPIASNTFINSLKNAGIDNFQYFPVPIIEKNRIIESFNIVNYIGRISCLDEIKTECTKFKNKIVRVKSLCIKESNTHNLPLFRIHEYELLVLINSHVKDHLSGLKGVVLSPAQGWNDRHRF